MNPIIRIHTLLAAGLLLCNSTAFAFYNPAAGRWLSRDPIEEMGHELLKEHSESFVLTTEFGLEDDEEDESEISDATFMNHYAFAANSPVYAIDPNGELTWVPRVLQACGGFVIKGYQKYQSVKKARKVLAATCDTIWAGYKAACAVGCQGATCEQVSKFRRATRQPSLALKAVTFI